MRRGPGGRGGQKHTLPERSPDFPLPCFSDYHALRSVVRRAGALTGAVTSDDPGEDTALLFAPSSMREANKPRLSWHWPGLHNGPIEASLFWGWEVTCGGVACVRTRCRRPASRVAVRGSRVRFSRPSRPPI